VENFDNDVVIFSLVRISTIFLGSVPWAWDEADVRVFTCEKDITDRYGSVLDITEIIEHKHRFIFKGVCKGL